MTHSKFATEYELAPPAENGCGWFLFGFVLSSIVAWVLESFMVWVVLNLVCFVVMKFYDGEKTKARNEYVKIAGEDLEKFAQEVLQKAGSF